MTDHPRSIDTAPKGAPLDDYGPTVILTVNGVEVDGHWCSGLEMGDFWIPPGWYVDEEDDPIEPTAWRPKS